MNVAVKLAYLSDCSPVTRFDELDCVRLLKAVEDMDGKRIEAGTKGTIVAIWADGEAYEVEFVRPIQALATVMAEDLEPAPVLA